MKYRIRTAILILAAVWITFQATRWHVQAEYMGEVRLAYNLPVKGVK